MATWNSESAANWVETDYRGHISSYSKVRDKNIRYLDNNHTLFMDELREILGLLPEKHLWWAPQKEEELSHMSKEAESSSTPKTYSYVSKSTQTLSSNMAESMIPTPLGRVQAPNPTFSCGQCAGLEFNNKQEHDLYVFKLRNACPDLLQGRPICRSYKECISKGRMFLCPPFSRGHDCVATGPESPSSLLHHTGFIHTAMDCRAASGEECDTKHHWGEPCWQNKQQVHIKASCVSILKGQACFRGQECTWGHDHEYVRKVIYDMRIAAGLANLQREKGWEAMRKAMRNPNYNP